MPTCAENVHCDTIDQRKVGSLRLDVRYVLLALQMIFASVITFKSVSKDRIDLNAWLISYLLQASPVNQYLLLSPSTGANKCDLHFKQ